MLRSSDRGYILLRVKTLSARRRRRDPKCVHSRSRLVGAVSLTPYTLPPGGESLPYTNEWKLCQEKIPNSRPKFNHFAGFLRFSLFFLLFTFATEKTVYPANRSCLINLILLGFLSIFLQVCCNFITQRKIQSY